MTEWQPIETAPKEPTEFSGFGPLVLLASNHGHRAVGYWSNGDRMPIGWVNPHHHRVMSYWNKFAWWSEITEPPK